MHATYFVNKKIFNQQDTCCWKMLSLLMKKSVLHYWITAQKTEDLHVWPQSWDMNAHYPFVLEYRIMQDFCLFFSQNCMFSGSLIFLLLFSLRYLSSRNRFNCSFISISHECFLKAVNVDSQLMESQTQLNCILSYLFINLSLLIINDVRIALSKTI